MNLSQNFPRGEFERSQVATRAGIENRMGAAELSRARALCLGVMQPIRDAHGPTIITSGFRCGELNKRVGGSKESQHMEGGAADFECIGHGNLAVARWVRDNLSGEFDQLILEFYDPADPAGGWVHVSRATDPAKNRGEVLTATLQVSESGKTSKVVYKEGLP